MKKILMVLSFLMFIGSVKAECSYQDISKYKSFVGNINISYSYRIDNSTAYFDVTLSNIPNGVYFEDSTTGIKYDTFKNNEIIIKNYMGTNVSYRFYSSICDDEFLGSKYLSFPVYNIYSTDELCKGIENFSLCRKWADVRYSYSDFALKVHEYKESIKKPTVEDNTIYKKSFTERLIEFYINNYYYLLGSIIFVGVGLIIYLKKKNSIDLEI